MPRLAAIDVGTNTVRLLVADRLEGGELIHLLRDLEITRLGRGVDAGRRLDPRSAERTLEAVRAFSDRAREAGAEGLRIAGTSVLRDAADRDAFLAAVREATGTAMEILSGKEEGRLAYLGATQGAGSGPFVVCDVGGGSTELIRGAAEAEALCSMDVGSVRVRERCLGSDPPTSEEVVAARSWVGDELERAAGVLGLTGNERLIGVAGTVTTLAALALGVLTYDPDRIHGTRLGRDAVADWCERLLGMSTDEVRGLPTMQPGRADVIGAGALVLLEIMGSLGFEDLTVSERDVLDGLVLDA